MLVSPSNSRGIKETVISRMYFFFVKKKRRWREVEENDEQALIARILVINA